MNFQEMNRLEYAYFSSVSKSGAYLLLHRIRGGIQEAYTQTLLTKLRARDETVHAFNFPHMTRGE